MKNPLQKHHFARRHRYLYKGYRSFFQYGEWRKKKVTPAGEFIIAVLFISAILGIDTYSSMVYQIFSLLLPLVIMSLFLSLRKKKILKVRRDLPEHATAGKEIHYAITVFNTSDKIQKDFSIGEELDDPRPTLADFVLKKEPYEETRNAWDRKAKVHIWTWLVKQGLNADVRSYPLPQLSSGGHIRVKAGLTPVRRGFIYFRGFNILLPEILGLTRSFYILEKRDKLLVLPRRYTIPNLLLPGSRKHHRGGVSLTSDIGNSDEFISLREYRPGDPMKQIHWKSWAKTGKLIIRENQDEHFVRHALILDTNADEIQEDIFEEAVSIAASFVSHVKTGDSILDLIFAGEQVFHFSTGRGLSNTRKLLEILALVKPVRNNSFLKLKSRVLQNQKALSSCILIFTHLDEERKDLIRTLEVSGVPVMVLFITDQPDPVSSGNVYCINPKDVQKGLNRAGGFS